MVAAALSACQPWQSHFTPPLRSKGCGKGFPMKRLLVSILFFLLLLTTAFLAKAQTNASPFEGAPTEYSVDVVTTRKSGTPFLIKMYVDGAKRRTEQDTNNGGLVVILRGDVHMMYTVLVTRKLYRISSFDPKVGPIEPSLFMPPTDCKPID
jgi:hypothetical protein